MSSTDNPYLFEMYRGDDMAFSVDIKDTLDNAIDITGWSFKSTMKLNVMDSTDSNAPVQVDIPALSGVEAAAGLFTLHLPSTQTTNMEPGVYWFDLQRELNGLVVTVLQGKVKVLPDVTRRSA